MIEKDGHVEQVMKPCPFCGEEQIEKENVGVDIDGDAEWEEAYYCWNCGANAPLKWWNKRAS